MLIANVVQPVMAEKNRVEAVKKMGWTGKQKKDLDHWDICESRINIYPEENRELYITTEKQT